jgi:hypothetical protein
MGMTFSSWLDRFPIKYIDADQPFKWRLQSYHDKAINLLAAWTDELGTSAVSASTKAGIGQSYIYLDFPENRFSTTAIIAGDDPDLYKFLVVGDPIQVGNGWRYRVKLAGADSSEYAPYDQFLTSTRWKIEGGAVSQTGSTRGQDISFATAFDMEERISSIRFQHKVHGHMINLDRNKPFIFDITDSEGNVHTNWLSYEEWELIKQFHIQKAKNTFYGFTTVDADGHSMLQDEAGNSIYQGRGIRAQLLPTSQHYYNTISLDFLTEAALSVCVGKIDPSNRTFVIGTGEWGLMELSKMIQREFYNGGLQNANWLGDTTGRAFDWVGGAAGNELKMKMGQFVGAATINGINFKFMHLPHYDDLVRNTKAHPKGGYAESHRMTIMDIGNRNEPNVQKIRIKGFEPIYKYIPGIRNPFSTDGLLGKKPGMAVSSFDGYELHILDKEGAVVLDPTRCMEFIPAVLRGRKQR